MKNDTDFVKPMSWYLKRHIYKFYSLGQSNFTTILITVKMRILMHTSFIHIHLGHNLFLVYKLTYKVYNQSVAVKNE